MINNIYKSYITTIAGVLFLIADLVYFLTKDSPDLDTIKWIGLFGIVLLFVNDKYIKKLLEKFE